MDIHCQIKGISISFSLFYNRLQTSHRSFKICFFWQNDNFFLLVLFCFLCTVCVLKRECVAALTSEADVGQSSWFPSEIRAAEPSAQRSAGDHQCCYLRFHLPGAKHHTHKQMQSLLSQSLFSGVCYERGNIKGSNCIQFWIASQTQEVAATTSQPCCGKEPLGCRYQCTKAKKMWHSPTQISIYPIFIPDNPRYDRQHTVMRKPHI